MRKCIFAALVAVCLFAEAQQSSAGNYYLPSSISEGDVGEIYIDVNGKTYDLSFDRFGNWAMSADLANLLRINANNATVQIAYNALKRAIQVEVETKLLAEYVWEMMDGDGFYVEYTDTEGNAKIATVKYYDKAAKIGTEPPDRERAKLLKTGKILPDDVTIEKSANGIISFKSWSSGPTAQQADLSEYLAGDSVMVDDAAYKDYALVTRKSDGTLVYIPIGRKLNIKQLETDGESITTNEVQGGHLSVVGFGMAKESANGVPMLPYTIGENLEWANLQTFTDQATTDTDYDGQLTLMGFADAEDKGIPVKDGEILAWKSIGQMANDILFDTDDSGKLILKDYNGTMGPNLYFGTDDEGTVGWCDLPQQGFAVDGQSITTNAAEGAASDGVASIMYWTTAKSAASSSDPYLPYTMGSTLGWHGLSSFVDGETLVKDSNAGQIKLNGWGPGIGARHYYGTSTDGSGPGFYELPNVTTNTVEADEITITSDTSEDGKTKTFLLKGSKEAKSGSDGEPKVPYIAGEFAWKSFSEFFDANLFAKNQGGNLTLKGGENGKPSSNKYFGTDSGGSIGFHERFPAGDGAYVATQQGWQPMNSGMGGYGPDNKSLDLTSSGSTTNLQVKGWATAQACGEDLYNLITTTDTGGGAQHLLLAKVGESLHYLPMGTDKVPLPDGTTISTTSDTPPKLRVHPGSEAGKWMKSDGSTASWADLPTIQKEDGSSITVSKDSDGNYTIGGGGSSSGITVEGDSNSASGTVFKVASADDSAVKVDVEKSGDTVCIKIGVYYK